ncbi:Sec-independent protein translocase protein TatB [Neisseriaceae bacterium ESL0693]|nr:Sec-independent protein translocase protein TatB [Neisseriaceae bacterium ESL0693]
MFGLGWSEILLIAVVALVVLGPERLPKVARTTGLWVGRIQNFISHVKTEISTQAGVAEFREARDSIEAAARSFQHEIDGNVRGLRGEVDALKRQISGDEVVSVVMPSYPASIAEPTVKTIAAPMPLHQVSLRRQAWQRKRDVRARRASASHWRLRRRKSHEKTE